MSLRERLIGEIGRTGPISIADYMNRCLHDPDGGYYAAQPRLGEGGDFITAPHVSQMFGELIGVWAVETWTRLGSPARVRLVELGPGDGTMIGDVLRVARVAPAFLSAVELWLVETSAPLEAVQRAALGGQPAQWARRFEDVPSNAPMIVVANEFLDCLPISQWLGAEERRVGLDAGRALAFTPAGQGPVAERSDALAAIGASLGETLARAGGAALLIDYGRDRPGCGDTLQALRGHRKESPLANPGLADLTAHVDFPAFLAAARGAGAGATLRSQARFLREMGIETRAAALSREHPDQADKIARQLERLIGKDQMGALFKAAVVHARDIEAP